MKNQTFDFSTNVLQALLWQENQADALQSIMRAEQAWLDANQRDFWDNWFTNVFNLNTADAFGCAVWSKILNIPLAVVIDRRNTQVFGYGSSNQNYGHGNYSQTQQITLNLTIEQKRLVLKLRYLQLISDGTVPQTNRFLQWIFGSYGPCWVLDPLDMGLITYVFSFALPSEVRFVLTFYDLLPRPAGCGVRIVTTVAPRFAYGPNRQNYLHGNYAPG